MRGRCFRTSFCESEKGQLRRKDEVERWTDLIELGDDGHDKPRVEISLGDETLDESDERDGELDTRGDGVLGFR